MSTQSGFMGRLSQERKQGKSLKELDRSVLVWLGSYLKPYRGALFTSALFMIVVALANAAPPYLVKVAVDGYITTRDSRGLMFVLPLFLAIYLVYWAASYWGRHISVQTGQTIVANIRRDLFSKVLLLSQGYHDAKPMGDTISRLVSDVNSIADLVSYGLTGVIGDVFTLIAMGLFMLHLNPRLALVAFSVIPVILLGTSFIGRLMRDASRDVRQKLSSLTSGVEENVAGARAVRSLGREKESARGLERLSQENYSANLKAIVSAALFFPFMSASGSLGTALVVLVGGNMVYNGALSVGVLVAFLTYVGKFFVPLRELSQLFSSYQAAAAALERMHEVMVSDETLAEDDTSVELPLRVKGEIRFDNVSFEYKKGEPIIKNLSLRINPGEVLAVVGKSGAGKTTLLKLLTRLYDVSEGSISLDGHDIRSLSLKGLRDAISVVPQDVFLFDSPIEDNIVFAKPDTDHETVLSVAQSMGLDDFVKTLPRQYSTRVGEGGRLLSGGQRQMVSFARAALADRPVLVLDEATSSLDAVTESKLQDAMRNLFRGRTVLLIAHRFSTIKNADRIVVLDQGRVVADGNHLALMESSEIYRDLYLKQAINTASVRQNSKSAGRGLL